ncbi:MAG: cobyrinate a,c-diamide synthase [Candidatus Puniceispirillales bacterium]
MARRGIMIAGLSSGSGKTLISLGLMRAAKNRQHDIAAAKAGPDYIDPGFHQAALGKPSVNLDPFAMPPGLIRDLAARQDGDVLLVEGVMGVHDGGAASSAGLAAVLGIPAVLVMDIRSQAETAAAIAAGLRTSLAAEGVQLGGVILNRCRSARHEAMIRAAMNREQISIVGVIPDEPGITVPSRHLGLVQAADLPEREDVLDRAAAIITDHVDLEAILAAATTLPEAGDGEAMPPPHARIAVASDAAFSFAYPHLLEGWARQGARLAFFSPLADETPPADSGFIFLPGGYPELHLPVLSRAGLFMESLRDAAASGVAIYGECGGYMVLGQAITDADGRRSPMAGLLNLETSFAAPERRLGYRMISRCGDALLPEQARGHEFHYTKAIHEDGSPLFSACDRDGHNLGRCGLVEGSVSGSYLHLIAEA